MSAGLAKETGRALIWKAVQRGAGRAIGFVRTLVLARLLVPEDFGLLAIGIVTVELLLGLTDFGLRPALVQRHDPEDRAYDTAWTIEVTRALAVAAGMIVAAPWISRFLGEPGATDIIRVLALHPVLAALGSIKTTDLERALRFRPLTMLTLGSSLTQAVVSIGLAPALGVWALVIGVLSGTVVGAVLSYVVAPYTPRMAYDHIAIRPLFRFGRWIYLTTLVGILGSVIMQAVISRRLGVVELGLFSIGVRLACLPNELVSEVVGEVAFPLHARLQTQRERSKRAFQWSLIGSWALLLPAYAILIALAPVIVTEILGERWQGAVPVIRVLSVAGIIGVIFDATAPVLQALGRPQGVTLMYGIRSLMILALVWTLASRFGLAGAAVAWLVAEAGVQIAASVLARRILPRPFEGLLAPVAALMVAASVAALAAWVIDAAVGGLPGLVLSGSAAVTTAGLVLMVLDRRLDLGILEVLSALYPQAARLLSRTSRRGASV